MLFIGKASLAAAVAFRLFRVLRRAFHLQFAERLNVFLGKEVVYAAYVFPHLSIAELIYFRHKSVQKITIVRYYYRRAIKSENSLFQHVFGLHVQMVCRLVENKQIDWFEQKLYHGKPASLSTRKIPDIFFIGFASKHKRSQYIVYLKAYISACSPVNSVVNRYVFVQKLCLVLRIVSNVNVMPYLQFPSKRNLPHNALHKR